MTRLIKQAVALFFLLILAIAVLPRAVLASTYGECAYGESTYGNGCAASPTPSSGTSGSSDSGTSAPSAPSCTAQAPGSAPWLYGAIPQSSTSILLYFTDAGDPVDSYALEFGTSSGSYQFGATNIGPKGMRTYLVQSLQANTTYYFRVRGGNGCAPGAWSNELSAKTLSLVAFNQLLFPASDLTTTPLITTPRTTPVPGSGEGTGEEITEETEPITGYDVKIKVVDTKQQPVDGATVTIHSDPQTAFTNEKGIVEFSNVEPGDHRIVVAYNGFEGEQAINLTGDVQEFNLTITIQPKNVLLAPQVLAVVGVMTVVILILLILLIRSKRKTPTLKKLV